MYKGCIELVLKNNIEKYKKIVEMHLKNNASVERMYENLCCLMENISILETISDKKDEKIQAYIDSEISEYERLSDLVLEREFGNK